MGNQCVSNIEQGYLTPSGKKINELGATNRYVIYNNTVYIYHLDSQIFKLQILPNDIFRNYIIVYSPAIFLTDVLSEITDIWIDKNDNIFKLSDISDNYLENILLLLETENFDAVYKNRKPHILAEIRKRKFKYIETL